MQTSSNDIKGTRVIRRGAAVLGVAAVGASWLRGVASRVIDPIASGAPPHADELLTALAAGAALVGLGWLALGVALAMLAEVPGAVGRGARAVADVLTPRLLRRTVGVLLGVGVVAGLSAGASVASAASVASTPAAMAGAPRPDPGFRSLPDPGWSVTSDAVAAGSVASPPVPDPGWVPTAPTVRPQPDVRVLSRAPRPPDAARPAEVVVRRGDSLWTIAARHLGPDASDAEIADAWPAWFAANRDVVGADPDVLLPGQVLRAPDAVRS